MIASEYFRGFQFQSSQSSRETFCETNSQNDRRCQIAPKQKTVIKYDVKSAASDCELERIARRSVRRSSKGSHPQTSARLHETGSRKLPSIARGRGQPADRSQRSTARNDHSRAHPQWCYACLRSNSSLRRSNLKAASWRAGRKRLCRGGPNPQGGGLRAGRIAHLSAYLQAPGASVLCDNRGCRQRHFGCERCQSNARHST
jgi:hypothetical protein